MKTREPRRRGTVRKRLGQVLAIGLAGVLATMSLFAVAGCSGSSGSGEASSAASGNGKKITVGVCAGPYGDMFKDAIAPTLEQEGYQTDVIEFSDIVTPDTALDEGDIDVNIFQHSIYLKNFNKEHNTDLTYLTEIPTAGMGVFSNKYKKIDELPDKATIGIPNDVTNTARAFKVLAQTGIITLKKGAVDEATVTAKDIEKNPKHLQFKEMNPEVLPNVLGDVDAAVINGYFAIAAGLDLSTDLYNEKVQPGYVNVIAIKPENKDTQWAKDIYAAVHSDAFRKVIEDPQYQYKSFTKPKDYDKNA